VSLIIFEGQARACKKLRHLSALLVVLHLGSVAVLVISLLYTSILYYFRPSDSILIHSLFHYSQRCLSRAIPLHPHTPPQRAPLGLPMHPTRILCDCSHPNRTGRAVHTTISALPAATGREERRGDETPSHLAVLHRGGGTNLPSPTRQGMLCFTMSGAGACWPPKRPGKTRKQN
jgi:hypothetical protein